MITTEDKTITPTVSASTTSATSINAGTAPASRPVANMDETDWTTMLMEMRILSA